MRHVLVVLIAVIFLALMLIIKQHKEKLFIAGLVLLCLINGAYSFTHAETILASRKATSQTFYSPEYLESGEFADAFLRLFLSDRKVYVKNDRWILEDAEDAGYEWIYAYYHVDNMVNYLNSLGTVVIEDGGMNEVMVPSDKESEFERVGYLNDLLRNSLMYSKFDNQCGNYFFYLNYYRDISDTAYLYANPSSLEEEELVLIWQPRSEDNVETEDMYLMGKNYYEKNIKN